MNLNPWSMLFHAINAILLIVAYRYWMYVPVRKFLDARSEKFRAEREEIDATLARTKQEEIEARAELDNARIQATKTLQESHSRLELEAGEILKQAHADAANVIDEASARATDMLERSQDEIRSQAVELAINIAAKVLAREVKPSDNQQIIDQFLTDTAPKA